jgi:hypothetical protein
LFQPSFWFNQKENSMKILFRKHGLRVFWLFAACLAAWWTYLAAEQLIAILALLR